MGVMISSVGITSYILDTFPTASGEVSSIVNLSRTISGFSGELHGVRVLREGRSC